MRHHIVCDDWPLQTFCTPHKLGVVALRTLYDRLTNEEAPPLFRVLTPSEWNEFRSTRAAQTNTATREFTFIAPPTPVPGNASTSTSSTSSSSTVDASSTISSSSTNASSSTAAASSASAYATSTAAASSVSASATTASSTGASATTAPSTGASATPVSATAASSTPVSASTSASPAQAGLAGLFPNEKVRKSRSDKDKPRPHARKAYKQKGQGTHSQATATGTTGTPSSVAGSPTNMSMPGAPATFTGVLDFSTYSTVAGPAAMNGHHGIGGGTVGAMNGIFPLLMHNDLMSIGPASHAGTPSTMTASSSTDGSGTMNGASAMSMYSPTGFNGSAPGWIGGNAPGALIHGPLMANSASGTWSTMGNGLIGSIMGMASPAGPTGLTSFTTDSITQTSGTQGGVQGMGSGSSM